MNKQILWTLLKYALGFGLLATVIWRYWQPQDGSPGLADALTQQVHVAPLLLAVGIYLLGLILTFFRWYLLVRAQNLPFTLTSALRLGLIGYCLSTFLPGSVGGDIMKAACIAREQNRRTVAVATVLIDRLIGFIGLFWLVSLLGGLFWANGLLHTAERSLEATRTLETIVVGSWLLTGGSLTFWLVLGVLSSWHADRLAARLERLPKVGHSLAEFWRAVWMYRNRGGSVLVAVLLSVLGHIGFVLTFYFAALTLTSPQEIPSLESHFLVVPVGLTIQAVPLIPGGAGLSEWGFGELYQAVGASAVAGVLGSLVQRAITWALALVGYVVYLRMGSRRQRAAADSDPELTVANADMAAAVGG